MFPQKSRPSQLVIESFSELKIRYHRDGLSFEAIEKEVRFILDRYQGEKAAEYKGEAFNERLEKKYLKIIKMLLDIQVSLFTQFSIDQIFSGKIDAKIKKQLESKLSYPVDHLILHVMAERAKKSFYVPKPKLTSEEMMQCLEKKADEERAKRLRLTYVAHKHLVQQMGARSREQELEQEKHLTEEESKRLEIDEKAAAIAAEERSQVLDQSHSEIMRSLEVQQSALQRRELNLHFSRELFAQYQEQELVRGPTNAERIITDIERLNQYLAEVDQSIAERISQQTELLLTKITSLNDRLQSMSQENKASNKQLIQMQQELEQQILKRDKSHQQKLTCISGSIRQLSQEQDRELCALKVSLGEVSVEARGAHVEQMGAAKNLYDKIVGIQEMAEKQFQYCCMTTKKYTQEIAKFSTQLAEVRSDIVGVKVQLDDMLNALDDNIAALSRQNKDAFQQLGYTVQALLGKSEETIKRAMRDALGSIRGNQRQMQQQIQALVRLQIAAQAAPVQVSPYAMFAPPRPTAAVMQNSPDPSAEVIYQQGLAYKSISDRQNAERYLQEAASKGHVKAQTTFAVEYLIPQGRKSEAYQLLLQSAKQHHARAQYNLALMLEHGDGIAMDLEQAKHWYEQSGINSKTAKGKSTAQEAAGRVKDKLDKTSRFRPVQP
jgi:hypothetical protein